MSTPKELNVREDASNEKYKEVKNALLNLAESEIEVENIEKDVELYRINKMKPVYKKRDSIIENIPEFWKIVLSQHANFANFIRASDFKYIDCIEKVVVDWDEERNFKISFHFNKIDGDFPAQVVTKSFNLVKIEDDERDENDEDEEEMLDTERLISEPTNIVWPKSYDSINPSLIENKKTPEGKKNYRQGMKSFFGWFKWTGLNPGKEFPHGDSLATLFAEELYPYCVKYYTEAQRDLEDEASDSEYDSTEGPLDLDRESDDNEQNEPLKKKQKSK